MKLSTTVSSICPGSIPLALAKRASRDRPICARFSKSIAINSVQAGLNGAFDFRSTGLHPLAFTAARKPERMLAKLFRQPSRDRVDGRELRSDSRQVERDGGWVFTQERCHPFDGRALIPQPSC